MSKTVKDLATKTLTVDGKDYTFYSLKDAVTNGSESIKKLPYSIRVLLESVIRQYDGTVINKNHVDTLAAWADGNLEGNEVPFKPSRVVLQDFTGVPAVVDLASLRKAMSEAGGDVQKINPEVPVDLVIDHSVQVDEYGTHTALQRNMELEFARNNERYEFLRWATKAFDNYQAVPPATGIVHQVNIEYLANVVHVRDEDEGLVAYPDTLVGTDSHTTMVNGMGVLGWGVGGIEAEAGMLGQPSYMPTPEVIGVRLKNALPEGATATDLALHVTELLRKKGVVGKFVEFFGDGVTNLPLADRATISNMAPEYGATCGFFPVDDETLDYMRLTGRSEDHIKVVEAYLKENDMFFSPEDEPVYTDVIELDLKTVKPALAGPKRPQDLIYLPDMQKEYRKSVTAKSGNHGHGLDKSEFDKVATVDYADGSKGEIKTGDLVIAAITSCTNTSNPYVMLGAGLLAKKAVEKGLSVPKHVKTSLAPGSKVVTGYLEDSGVQQYLDTLGFQHVGYGCTTCIGNSGPLKPEITKAVVDEDLLVSSVLSGNRNFEGRIHPLVKANYLASPPLVVAYALAGTVDIDLQKDAIGTDSEGNDVYLHEIWPSQDEIKKAVHETVTPELFKKEYANIFDSNETWNAIETTDNPSYDFNDESTYIQNPSFFEDLSPEPSTVQPLDDLKVLLKLGDSVTTDHISPAGAIGKDTPAGKWLIEQGVSPRDFNSYGSRRGNHEVMVRGTFANIRIRNEIAPGTEGGYTTYWPTGEVMSVYDASLKYQEDGTGLVVIAGEDYGMGSSRDWAAKGTNLLGVRAVIAASYERIHRSNLVFMGVLPLEFLDGEDAETHGLKGDESFDIQIDEGVKPGETVEVVATNPDGEKKSFKVKVRFDSDVEVDYYRHGGILQMVLRDKLAS